MDIKIDKVVYPGKSMAKIDGKVIFTDQGLPGETVEVSVLKETKSYAQCRTVKIITPSPHRQAPRCKHYETCSLYQYIDYPEQIEIKKQQLREMLSRQLKIDLPDIKFRPSEKIWGYRNKIKLKVIWNGRKAFLAYNLPKSLARFVAVDECFLSPGLTNSFLKAFVELISARSFKSIAGLTVRENAKNQLLVNVYYDPSMDIKIRLDAFEGLVKKFPISGFMFIDQKTLNRTALFGDCFFKEAVNDIELCVGPESFFQINTGMLSVLVNDMQNNLDLGGDKTLADLYCGVGTFGIILSQKVKKVIGVESDPENFFFMKKNIEMNNIKNFEARLCTCEKNIRPLLDEKPDLVIVDPPRKGLDAGICNALAESGPPGLAYISCDPATLARDLKILLSGYDIKNLYAYDFFPHTPHIETMALLSRI
jgi:23S rRNA (uracil1939-C5)-methyltransferase